MAVDELQHILKSLVRNPLPLATAQRMILDRIAQHGERAAHQDLGDLLRQLAAIVEQIGQQALRYRESDALSSHAEAGAHVRRHEPAPQVSRDDQVQNLMHLLFIGVTFHVERCHRLRDGEVAGPNHAVTGLMRDAQAAPPHEPQDGHVGGILADVRPRPAKEHRTLGAQAHDRAGADRLLICSYVDARVAFDRIIPEVILLVARASKTLLTMLIVPVIECEYGLHGTPPCDNTLRFCDPLRRSTTRDCRHNTCFNQWGAHRCHAVAGRALPMRAAIMPDSSNNFTLPVAVLGTSSGEMKMIRRGIL
jgi:hypothetical protein